MTFTPIASLSSVALVATLLAGCGSDDGAASGSGDLDAFCAEFDRSDEEQADLTEDPDAVMADMERVRDLAPSSIRGDIDVLIESFREIESLEAESTGESEEPGDEFAAVLEVAFDPAFIEASENLEAFAVSECGIDPADLDETNSIEISGFDEEEVGDGSGVEASSSDGSVGDDAAGDESVGPVVSEAAEGVPDPLFDPWFDEEIDLGVPGFQGAQYFLDVEYTDSPWRTKLGSWGFYGADAPTLEAGGLDLTEAEATEACGALVGYLAQFSSDGTVTVSTYEQNDDGTFGEQTELVSGTVDGGC